MLGETHELMEEFPEYRGRIVELRMDDTRFAELCREYDKVNREIIRIEQHNVNTSDFYWEDLKKERLRLKDELYAILRW